MYKRSEPIKSLHSVQNHMANVYSSEVCLQTKKFPKISKFFFSKNTPKYDKLSKISNISTKTILKLRTKLGNFRNFRNFKHISDRLRTIHNTCSNLIGSEPLYILPTVDSTYPGEFRVQLMVTFPQKGPSSLVEFYRQKIYVGGFAYGVSVRPMLTIPFCIL